MQPTHNKRKEKNNHHPLKGDTLKLTKSEIKFWEEEIKEAAKEYPWLKVKNDEVQIFEEAVNVINGDGERINSIDDFVEQFPFGEIIEEGGRRFFKCKLKDLALDFALEWRMQTMAEIRDKIQTGIKTNWGS
jgi:hypothetical protein